MFSGDGEATYLLGVGDNGKMIGLNQAEIESSMATINIMATKIGASVTVVSEKAVENGPSKKRKALEIAVRKISEDRQTAEVRIVVLGNAEAGKSSLLGMF